MRARCSVCFQRGVECLCGIDLAEAIALIQRYAVERAALLAEIERQRVAFRVLVEQENVTARALEAAREVIARAEKIARFQKRIATHKFSNPPEVPDAEWHLEPGEEKP